MKIACIGNYPPRECGIATFTKDFIGALMSSDDWGRDKGDEAYVIAMNDQGRTYDYPSLVVQQIDQNQPQDYLKAVNYINLRNTDICFLQHEFGIYGGNSGIYILPLIHRLKMPFIPIFHTVLKSPSYNERNIIVELGKRATKIVVMNSLAIEILETVYDIPREKIIVIPHGVPAFDFTRNIFHKRRFNVEGRKTLMTFGLLSRNKGLETVINALPEVVKNHPDLIYIIAGKTHPSVLRSSGEEYRNYLKLLVRKDELYDHVFFDDRFLETDELLGYLSAADLYVTPYLNEAQITSGTLAYAVGAGTAVISTPYWHAMELLAEDRGVLFDFNDSEGLSRILIDLLDHPDKLKALRRRAFEYGKNTSWPQVGNQYLHTCRMAVKSFVRVRSTPAWDMKTIMPQFSLGHIVHLTDTTGIIQHAKYNIPNYKDGYCLDDNSRALLMSVMAYAQLKDRVALDLMPRYLGYIQYMQREDGGFRNFLSYAGVFLDHKGSEDSFGRTLWALGHLVRFAPSESFLEMGGELFRKSFEKIRELTSLRGMANGLIGLFHWIKRYPGDEGAVNALKELTSRILPRYGDHAREDWQWFEPSLTYDNGIIPYALLCSYELTGDEKTLDIAKRTMDFLDALMTREGYVSLIGTEGWYIRGGEPSRYDQQPVDAMALILMYYQAFIISRNQGYLQKMFNTFMWFLGENDLRVPLYDFETKGCNDGLKPYGVNRNQGAESSLSYLISYLTVISCYEFSF